MTFGMDVVDVEAPPVEAHRPGAADTITPVRLSDCSEVPADRRIDRTKQGANRRVGIIAQAAWGLASMPKRLIYRMGQGAVDPVERLAEIAEIIIQANPALRRIDAVGFDQPVIVVERLVAGVARKPPSNGQQGGDVLVAGARCMQRFAAPDRLLYPAERQVDLDLALGTRLRTGA